jgi:predicted transposase YbfD/YdcC
MDYNNEKPKQDIDEHGMIFAVSSLYAYLRKITDTRQCKGKRYGLATLLVVIILAKLAGEDKPSGISDWVAERVEPLRELKILKRPQAPCHMTYRRVMQTIVRVDELDHLLHEYHQQCLETEQEIVLAIDGKTLRGTIPYGELRGTHLLTVYVPQQGLVLAQAQVDQKENEIVVAPQVLRQVNLQGAIVIGDAMHTQRETSRQIVAAGGDYVWFVKGNQARTEWAIQKLFVHEMCNLRQGASLAKDFQTYTQVSKGHGRLETRTIFVSTLLNDYLDWSHLAQVFRLERVRWHPHYRGRTREIVYGLTSLSPVRFSPERLLRLTQAYWGIENGLHYRRDVTLHEDATRLTIGNAGHIMAAINNLVIGLCLRHHGPNVAKARRHFSACPEDALQLLLAAG